MSTSTETTLSRRGFELASGATLRGRFEKILKNPYDHEKNPDGFVNMGTAENYAVIPEVKKFVVENYKLDLLDFTYGEGPWGTERLRKAMARHMSRTFNAVEQLDPQNLLIANGVTSICEMLAYTICDADTDGILLSRPIYQSFPIDFGLRGKVKAVYVSFGNVDQFSPDAAGIYETAIKKAESEGVKIRALMMCNPHNPLGRCYSKEAIIELMKLCQKYKIHLLSDEIYAASVYEVPVAATSSIAVKGNTIDQQNIPFTSALSFDYSSYITSDLVHVIYGMSKDFAAGGIRLGCIYIKNEELLRAMSSIVQFHWCGGPSQVLAISILEDEKWLDEFANLARSRLADRNAYTRKLLDQMSIKYLPSNAGFFIWIDLRPYMPKGTEAGADVWHVEETLIEKMIDQGLFLTNGKGLGSEEPGWFRLIFSHERQTILEGLKRLARIIDIKEPVEDSDDELSAKLESTDL